MSMSCSLLLRELKLSGNRIREFPEELISLPRLKFLDLSLNEIETLQATQVSFGNFQVKTVLLKSKPLYNLSEMSILTLSN